MPHVLAEDAEKHEWHAAEKQDGEEERRPAGDPDGGKEAKDEGIDNTRQRQPGGQPV